jgi:hypothetical protein
MSESANGSVCTRRTTDYGRNTARCVRDSSPMAGRPPDGSCDQCHVQGQAQYKQLTETPTTTATQIQPSTNTNTNTNTKDNVRAKGKNKGRGKAEDKGDHQWIYDDI